MTLTISDAVNILETKTFSVALNGGVLPTFTTGFSSNYDDYVLRFYNVSSSVSGSLNLQFSTNGGSSWDNGAHYRQRARSNWVEGGVSLELGDGASTNGFIGVDITDAAAFGNSGKVEISSPGVVAGVNCHTQWQSRITRTNEGVTINLSTVQGFYDGAAGTRINGIKIMSPSSATWSGMIRLYGIRNS